MTMTSQPGWTSTQVSTSRRAYCSMRWSAISARPMDRDVAAHGVRAKLDQRRIAGGGNVRDGKLRRDVAAARAGIDEQARAFLDPDPKVAGGRPEVDAVLEDAADLLVSR